MGLGVARVGNIVEVVVYIHMKMGGPLPLQSIQFRSLTGFGMQMDMDVYNNMILYEPTLAMHLHSSPTL